MPDTAIKALSDRALASFPVDAARVLERLGINEVAELLAGVEPVVAAAVLDAMALAVARSVFAALDDPVAGALAATLPAARAAVLLRGTARPERIDAVLATAPQRHASHVRQALAHRPNTAGALADPDVLALAPEVTAAGALDRIREQGTRGNLVYVVDREHRLQGLVTVAAVVAAAPETPLGEIATDDVTPINAGEPAFEIARNPGWSRWRGLPVIDDGRFVGVMRYDDLLEALRESPSAPAPLALPVAAAELVWLGLTGLVDGLARAVATTGEPR
jgi:magnesium transporter